MGAAVGAVITVFVGGWIGYVLGNRRLRFERLYERRAEVIARLYELRFLMQRGFLEWTSPFQVADVDRDTQRKKADEAFHELVSYYRSNSIWLDLKTCEKIESFLEIAWTRAWEYADELNERGQPQNKAGRDAALRMSHEILALKAALDTEFRAIMYPPPWYAPLLRLPLRIRQRNQQPSKSASEHTSQAAASKEAGPTS